MSTKCDGNCQVGTLGDWRTWELELSLNDEGESG